MKEFIQKCLPEKYYEDSIIFKHIYTKQIAPKQIKRIAGKTIYQHL